jgi:hypothetical protein
MRWGSAEHFRLLGMMHVEVYVQGNGECETLYKGHHLSGLCHSRSKLEARSNHERIMPSFEVKSTQREIPADGLGLLHKNRF